MSWGAVAAVGGAVIGGVMSSNASKNAAGKASDAQVRAAEIATEEQRRQFDAIRELMNPYVNAGTQGLMGQQDLLGLNGNEAQQNAINNISNSSEFQTYLNQGENSIRQNASATGGLRGGNTQAALSQFSPQLLNQMIGQRFTNLGGLTSLGQNAAAGVGNAGMQSANNISGLMQQVGAAQAGNALAQGQANANMWNGISNSIGTIGGMYASKNW
ncbi:hypothetical protein AS4_28640 [Acinetobacter guillouiae]|uniref:hypothetical protein n=1 Tax=Acinetobacter guillouiae TaxID=106649 RepID=UPI0004EF68ED|nr:hypothetical protein [Acinetobacter guillouiae]BAP37804.1 hypothetical protein AS4_28640 [Acinetobacter guillouiae]